MNSRLEETLPAFGARLRALRRARNLKQAALADMLNVDQTTISRWESGKQHPDGVKLQECLRMLVMDHEVNAPLSRLVATSADAVHLIEETSHRCLAASKSRLEEWGVSSSDILNHSLWLYATEEIAAAEDALKGAGWWDDYAPLPRIFRTSGHVLQGLSIKPARLLWERLYLADGTPVRLCTSLRSLA